jgi:hypothetical protein
VSNLLQPSNNRTLRLDFSIDGSESLSSTDFVSLFQCADFFCRATAEDEVISFVEELNLLRESRFEVISSIHRLGKRFPAPAAVESIERGSWNISLVMTGAATLFILRNTLATTLQNAWDESRLRELVLRFLRDHVFGGARRKAEEVAVGRSRWGNLRIQRVEERGLGPSGSQLTISLQRTEVVEAEITDQELVEEVLKRFLPK